MSEKELTTLQSKTKVRRVLTKHGMSRSPEYRVWVGMISRCYNPKYNGYKNYGERGIVICEEWRTSFIAFFHDMGPKPSPKLTIERLDNNKGYSPENCIWATRATQRRNTRTNRLIIFNGQTKCLMDWANELGMEYKTLEGRIKKGWPLEKALTTPTEQYSNRYVTYDGRTRPLFQWAKEFGIPGDILSSRLMRGWPVEEALTRPLRKSPTKTLTYEGITLTIKEWAKRVGIHRSTLIERLRHGWPVKDALYSPLQHSFHIKDLPR